MLASMEHVPGHSVGIPKCHWSVLKDIVGEGGVLRKAASAPQPSAPSAGEAGEDREEAGEQPRRLDEPKEWLNLNELVWFTAEERSKARRRLQFSADSERLGVSPGVLHLKQLSLAIQNHTFLQMQSDSSGERLLFLNVSQGPAKRMGLHFDTRSSPVTKYALSQLDLALAGPVGNIANDKSYKCAEVFGVPFYVCGTTATSFSSDVFCPGWLVKVDDKKANLHYVCKAWTMYFKSGHHVLFEPKEGYNEITLQKEILGLGLRDLDPKGG